MADAAEFAIESDLYEADEHVWIERQTALLRDGELHRLDRAHFAKKLDGHGLQRLVSGLPARITA